MLPVSENIANYAKVLSIQELIALAYLIPSYSTAISRNIRANEEAVLMDIAIEKELDQIEEINKITTENKKEIEEEILSREKENQLKAVILGLWIKLAEEQHKTNQLIIRQLNELKDSINTRLQGFDAQLKDLNSYRDTLHSYLELLESEHERLIKELDAIHFDVPFRVILDEKNNIFTDIDLNEILVYLRKNEDMAIKSINLAETFIQDKINHFINEKIPDQINKYKDFVKDNKLTDSIDKIDNFKKAVNVVDKDKIVKNEMKEVNSEMHNTNELENNLMQNTTYWANARDNLLSSIDNIHFSQLSNFTHDVSEVETKLKSDLPAMSRMKLHNTIESLFAAAGIDSLLDLDIKKEEKEQPPSHQPAEPEKSAEEEFSDFEKELLEGLDDDALLEDMDITFSHDDSNESTAFVFKSIQANNDSYTMKDKAPDKKPANEPTYPETEKKTSESSAKKPVNDREHEPEQEEKSTIRNKM